jgi:hypothetical protein
VRLYPDGEVNSSGVCGFVLSVRLVLRACAVSMMKAKRNLYVRAAFTVTSKLALQAAALLPRELRADLYKFFYKSIDDTFESF